MKKQPFAMQTYGNGLFSAATYIVAKDLCCITINKFFEAHWLYKIKFLLKSNLDQLIIFVSHLTVTDLIRLQ